MRPILFLFPNVMLLATTVVRPSTQAMGSIKKLSEQDHNRVLAVVHQVQMEGSYLAGFMATSKLAAFIQYAGKYLK